MNDLSVKPLVHYMSCNRLTELRGKRAKVSPQEWKIIGLGRWNKRIKKSRLSPGLFLRAAVYVVDGHVKCEKWIRDDDGNSEESKAAWWLNRLIGRKKKANLR
ncbi:hypothetical protein ACFE04_024617 [Oxalis oulophora]